MPRQSSLLKYNRLSQEILLDGCGDCSQCPANELCGGCNLCPEAKCPKNGCDHCTVKCWHHDSLDLWLKDVEGLSFDTSKCHISFSGELPRYIPQVQNNVFDFEYPAYIVNIHRLLCHKSQKWAYRKRGIKPHFHIPQSSKVLVSFCSSDELLEPIWTHSNNWNNNETFWAGLASYLHPDGIDGSFSIEFSCFSDAPRMDHLINMKRNILSLDELSQRNIPMILDATIRLDQDLARMVKWGKANGINWYVLNFQRTKSVQWLYRLIEARIETIIAGGGKVIVSGLGDRREMANLIGKYGENISLTNTVVSMNTNYYKELRDEKWVKSELPLKELFVHNMKEYCSSLGIKL